MSKITLNNVGNLQDTTTAETTLNSNNAVIQTAMDNTLSRDGTSPNTMNANIDMNSHQLINLPAPTGNSSPIRLQEFITLNSGGTVIVPTNLTGPITSVGAATSVASQTGTGSKFVMDTSPTLVTPTMSSPNITGHPTVEGVTSTGSTGTGKLVFDTSPTIVTPTMAIANIDSVQNTALVKFINVSAAQGIQTGSVVASNTYTDAAPTNGIFSRGNINTLGNVVFTTSGKGITGTTTNDSAAAGNVGEYVSSSVAIGSTTPLTTSTPINLVSISLTAGDWDVYFEPVFSPATTTSYTVLISSISLVSVTQDTSSGEAFAGLYTPAVVPGASNISLRVGPRRISIASTTTIFGFINAVFTVSTMAAWGTLRARRIR